METYQKELLHTMFRPSSDDLFADINPRAKLVMHKTFLFSSMQYFDYNWLMQSKQYTKDLSLCDKYTLKSYTSNGDMLANTYMRDNKIVSTEYIVFATQLFKIYDEVSESYYTSDIVLSEAGKRKAQNIIDQYKLDILKADVNTVRLRNVIEMYIQDLRILILNAPRCSKDMIVFRGVSGDYMQKENMWANLKGFQSASYSLDVAVTFRKSSLYEIVIKSGTPCIAMEYISRHSHEKEILLYDKNVYKMGSLTQKITLDSIHLSTEEGSYVEWDYILNKLINPMHDITKGNNNDSNILITPKQIEDTKRIYCTHLNRQIGGRMSVTRNNRYMNGTKTNTRKNTLLIKNKSAHVVRIGLDDQKSRFRDPMIVDKTFNRLSAEDERMFYQFMLDNGGDDDIPDYLKQLYPDIKKSPSEDC